MAFHTFTAFFDEESKMPYEKLLFCERCTLEPEGFVYYKELESFAGVEKYSKSKGTSRYYSPQSSRFPAS